MTTLTIRVCSACGTRLLANDRFCSGCGRRTSGDTPPPATSDLLLERLRRATIGAYDVQSELGRGGMAAVYLAQDLALHRKVAIKVMLPALFMSDGMAERFLLEARTAAQLSHPNIVVIHGVSGSEDLYYFVMSLVDGVNVDEILKPTQVLPFAETKWLLAQAARGLQYAHSERVVHRDVKPANMMLSTRGELVLTDFGIAKASDQSNHLTRTGSAVGTPAYMSPEQVLAELTTGASDQYMLGVVAYRLLTGTTPFQGSALEVQWSHVNRPPTPLRDLNPEVPEALASAVMRMLSKQPEARWESLEPLIDLFSDGSSAEQRAAENALAERARSAQRGKGHAPLLTPRSPLPSGVRPVVEREPSAAVATPQPTPVDFGTPEPQAPAAVTTETVGTRETPAPLMSTVEAVTPVEAVAPVETVAAVETAVSSPADAADAADAAGAYASTPSPHRKLPIPAFATAALVVGVGAFALSRYGARADQKPRDPARGAQTTGTPAAPPQVPQVAHDSTPAITNTTDSTLAATPTLGALVVQIDGETVSRSIAVRTNQVLAFRVTAKVGTRDTVITNVRSLAPEVVSVSDDARVLRSLRAGTATLVARAGDRERRIRVIVEAPVVAGGALPTGGAPPTGAGSTANSEGGTGTSGVGSAPSGSSPPVPERREATVTMSGARVETLVGGWLSELNSRPLELAEMAAPSNKELARALKQDGRSFSRDGGFRVAQVVSTTETGGRVVASFPAVSGLGVPLVYSMTLDVTFNGREIAAVTMVPGSLKYSPRK